MVAVAGADEEGRDELRIGADCRPRPHVAIAEDALLLGRDVLLFHVTKGPYLITLNVTAWQVPERLMLVAGARRARIHEQLRDGVDRDSGHPLGRVEGVAFDQG